MNQISDMIIFILKESINSIRNAKGSFLISLTSMSISLCLIALSFFIFDISEIIQDKLKENVVINAFINDSLSVQDTNQLSEELKSRKDVASLVYISKDKAAENFVKETGEDFLKILDYNPLPASFRITVQEDHISPSKLSRTVSEISGIAGVDEVVYGNQTLEKIYSIIATSKNYVLVITLVLVLLSVYIIFSTSNLIIKQRLGEMETMKLIGARIWAIKLPVILNSAYTGLLAGCISTAFFILFIYSIEGYIKRVFLYQFDYFLFPGVTILLGLILGIAVSTFALRKLTLKV